MRYDENDDDLSLKPKPPATEAEALMARLTICDGLLSREDAALIMDMVGLR